MQEACEEMLDTLKVDTQMLAGLHYLQNPHGHIICTPTHINNKNGTLCQSFCKLNSVVVLLENRFRSEFLYECSIFLGKMTLWLSKSLLGLGSCDHFATWNMLTQWFWSVCSIESWKTWILSLILWNKASHLIKENIYMY